MPIPFFQILKSSVKAFKNDNPIQLAAALSFISLFAIPPILMIIIFFIGQFFGSKEAFLSVHGNLIDLIGLKGANLLQEIVLNYGSSDKGLLRTIIGAFFFIVASTSIFGMMKKSLNDIWKIKPNPSIIYSLSDKLKSIGMIFGMGVLLLASLFLDAIMPIIRDYLNDTLPDVTYYVIKFVRFLFSFFASTLTFLFLFKFLPDVKLKWSVAWCGAFFTSSLFALGKGAITWSLIHFDIASMYGATGSMAAFLLWVFYSALIFYFGAEFTEQYAEYKEKTIEPNNNAIKYEIKEVGI